MISIIAAVGRNLELGAGGDLCFRLPVDLKYFKKVTMGHKVVMGSKTLESLPGGALKGRENYVLTRRAIDFPGAIELDSFEKALEMFRDVDEEVFVIGGASIYEQFLPFAKKLYLTEVDAETDADVYFTKFNKEDFAREVVERGECVDKISGRNLSYEFVIYTRKDDKKRGVL